jgi:glycosyltransferase involved in cell wall biosynthesis
MAADEPLLTIAIPTYNCARFLPDAIASIMRQGLDDFEILIVDNASEDNTEEVVRSFENPHIRYLRNHANLGSRENGNRCLANSHGQYIKFLCADDVLLDGILRKQLSVLETRPEVALVTCNYLATDRNLKIEGVCFEYPGAHPGRRVINYCLSRMVNCIGGPSNIMFRRTAAMGIGADNTFLLLSDLKFGLQVLQHGGYVNIDEPGYLYRRHPTSDYATNCPSEIHMPEYLRLVREFNWWNPLNCMVAFLLGGIEGRQFVREHWLRACAPGRVARSIEAFADFLYLRLRRLVNERKVVRRCSALIPQPKDSI